MILYQNAPTIRFLGLKSAVTIISVILPQQLKNYFIKNLNIFRRKFKLSQLFYEASMPRYLLFKGQNMFSLIDKGTSNE